jgi:hypothetical protein
MNEIQHVCAWCEQEFGVKVKSPDASHGMCARHAEGMIEDAKEMMKRANLPDHVIDNKVEEFKDRIKTGGAAPDMKETGIPPEAVKV